MGDIKGIRPPSSFWCALNQSLPKNKKTKNQKVQNGIGPKGGRGSDPPRNDVAAQRPPCSFFLLLNQALEKKIKKSKNQNRKVEMDLVLRAGTADAKEQHNRAKPSRYLFLCALYQALGKIEKSKIQTQKPKWARS